MVCADFSYAREEEVEEELVLTVYEGLLEEMEYVPDEGEFSAFLPSHD